MKIKEMHLADGVWIGARFASHLVDVLEVFAYDTTGNLIPEKFQTEKPKVNEGALITTEAADDKFLKPTDITEEKAYLCQYRYE